MVEAQPAQAFEHGHAYFFGGAGVHGGFVDNHVPGLQGLAHGFTGFDERRQVGAVGLVHRGGHRDDEYLTRSKVVCLAAKAQVGGGLQFLGAAFEGVVFARLQLGNAGGVDIKPQNGPLFAKFNRKRQAYISQANEGDGFFVEIHTMRWR